MRMNPHALKGINKIIAKPITFEDTGCFCVSYESHTKWLILTCTASPDYCLERRDSVIL
jgi:hypothetical protein